MSEGTVKWFNVLKGFGFIEQDDGLDIFVHANAIECKDSHPLLKEGERVQFVILQGNKGPMADKVTRVSL